MKVYNQMFNVGNAKYVVNFHDGIKTYKDGSAFFDIRIFKAKTKLTKFINELEADGYTYGTSATLS
jgi:hypothetical protein